MAGVASNEPTQRVSHDNGVFDGALIGMAVGAGGAGAGVFGTRMHYNGIDKRSERRLSQFNNEQDYIEGKMDSTTQKYEKNTDKKSTPNVFEKKKYNKAQSNLSDLNNTARGDIEDINTERQQRKQEVRQAGADYVNQTKVDEADSATKRRRGYGYSNPKVRPGDVAHTENVNNTRRNAAGHTRGVDAEYDAKVSSARNHWGGIIQNSDSVQTVNAVEQKISNRLNKVQNRYDKRMSGHRETLMNIQHKKSQSNPDAMRQKHAYSRMGGWKNAGIIGASAAIAGGVGMVSDGLNN